MATSREYIENFLELMAFRDVRVYPMMGEYVVYCNDIPVGCICDNRLFVKITRASRNLCPDAPEVPPYPGAKPRLLIESDDAEFLSELLHVLAANFPKSRKKRK